MLNLNSTLDSGFVPWDTNYARKYLQISEDQLEKLNKIPGWSKTRISEKNDTESEKILEKTEKQFVQPASTLTQKILTSSTNISVKDNFKNQNYNSDIQSKQNYLAPLNEKELFLKNVYLSPLRKKHTFAYSLQRSSSLPDLCKKSLFIKVLPRSNSEEICRKPIHSLEKDKSSFKIAYLSKENILNKPFTDPGFSYNDSGHNKLLEISNKSCSFPLENPSQQLSKQKFQPLDNSILNHKYLKDSKTSVITTKAIPLFSDGTIQTTLRKKMSLFEKKLLLLEKRLSPSKEKSPLPFNSKIINPENLNCQKNLMSSQIPAPADGIVTTVVSSDSVDLPGEIENSSVPKGYKSLDLQTNLQSINEKSDALKNRFEYAEDKTDVAVKTVACNFESFLSPPFPCGQPVLTEVFSQQIPSQKSDELNTSSKSQNIIPPVLTEISSEPILSPKLAELNTSSKSQNAELVGKMLAPEKPSEAFSVFSANLNEKGTDSASDKELGIKRKRKSKSEKSLKKFKRTDIQFSSAQIRNMIEIMKIFYTEF